MNQFILLQFYPHGQKLKNCKARERFESSATYQPIKHCDSVLCVQPQNTQICRQGYSDYFQMWPVKGIRHCWIQQKAENFVRMKDSAMWKTALSEVGIVNLPIALRIDWCRSTIGTIYYLHSREWRTSAWYLGKQSRVPSCLDWSGCWIRKCLAISILMSKKWRR